MENNKLLEEGLGGKMLKWSYVNIISDNAGWLKAEMGRLAGKTILENLFCTFFMNHRQTTFTKPQQTWLPLL